MIRFPREHLHEDGRYSVPRRISVENLRRRTQTEVTVELLELDPDVDIRLFTTDALLREAELTTRSPAP